MISAFTASIKSGETDYYYSADLVRPYSGRLIFDHFPKTAGQAVNAWLTEELGSGIVSQNLIGNHREMIDRAGHYSIISAHVHFGEGGGA